MSNTNLPFLGIFSTHTTDALADEARLWRNYDTDPKAREAANRLTQQRVEAARKRYNLNEPISPPKGQTDNKITGSSPVTSSTSSKPAFNFSAATMEELSEADKVQGVGETFVPPTPEELKFGKTEEDAKAERQAIYDKMREEHQKMVDAMPDGSQYRELMAQIQATPMRSRQINPFAAFAMAIANPQLAQQEVENRTAAMRSEEASRESKIFELQGKITEQKINKLMAAGEFDKALSSAKALQELNALKTERDQYIEEVQKSRARFDAAKQLEAKLASQARMLWQRLSAQAGIARAKGATTANKVGEYFIKFVSQVDPVTGIPRYADYTQPLRLALASAAIGGGTGFSQPEVQQVMSNFNAILQEYYGQEQQQSNQQPGTVDGRGGSNPYNILAPSQPQP